MLNRLAFSKGRQNILIDSLPDRDGSTFIMSPVSTSNTEDGVIFEM